MARAYEFVQELYFLGMPDGNEVLSFNPHYPVMPTHEQAESYANAILQWYSIHTPEEIEAINQAAEKRWIKEMYGYPRPPSPRKVESGYVYLIRSEQGAYKIGKSKNAERRISAMGVKLPFPIEPIQIIKTDDMNNLEAQLHYKFIEKRIEGEWFNLAPDDIEYIKGLAS